MPNSAKNDLYESRATADFVVHIMEKARDSWPTIYNNIKKLFSRWEQDFVVADEDLAIYNLALAAIAQESQAIKNLFPKEQAKRIKEWLLLFVGDEYAINEVKNYDKAFQESLDTGENPIHAISARLVQRWLGENIQDFVGKEDGIISPILLTAVSGNLIIFCGSWKSLKENFNIIKDESSIEEITSRV